MVIRMHIDVICYRTGIFWRQEWNWAIINDNPWIGQPNIKKLAFNGKITRLWQVNIQATIIKNCWINLLTKRNIFITKQVFEENDSIWKQSNYRWITKWRIFTIIKINKIITISVFNNAIWIKVENHCLN